MGIVLDPFWAQKFSTESKAMARVRNQKQGSPTKLSRRKKRTVQADPLVDSGDEENIVTEDHGTNDVRV